MNKVIVRVRTSGFQTVGYVSAAEQYQAQAYESICAEPGTCTDRLPEVRRIVKRI